MTGTSIKKTHFSAARTVGMAAVLLGAGVLSGCNMTGSEYAGPTNYVAVQPSERYPIQVTQNTVKLEVPIHSGATRLSPDVRADVRSFLSQYTSSGSSRLTVVQHPNPRHGLSSTSTMGELQQLVTSAGIPSGAVVYAHYPPGYAGREAPILMSFESYIAISPTCGDWSQNLAVTYENTPHPNFGCTSQANLAAMVADPRDLEQPRGETPLHGGRRDVVLENYRTGAATEADTSGSEAGSISEVGDE